MSEELKPPGNSSSETLPAFLTGLIGRERELEAVSRILQRPDVRLLTLVGPGGVGKTRIAVRVAELLHDSFDDVLFVDLSTTSDPALVVPGIAKALGVIEHASASFMERLAIAIAQLNLLLVLDNLEQIVGAGADLNQLLRICPGAKILATSRVSLRVSGEHEFPVPPLLPEESIALFAERARAVRPSFTLAPDNETTIAAVCDELDRLPLAIELAAARSKVLSPSALHARLANSLEVLTGGPIDQPTRLQTMRNAIMWSHDLLSESEQALFRRLSVFSGGFTLDAAEFVCADLELQKRIPVGTFEAPSVDSVLDGIAALVDNNLIRQSEDSSGEVRFGLLETIREFGLSQLQQSGELDDMRHRHTHWCDRLLDAAWPSFVARRDQECWLDRLETEHDNIRASLNWLESSGYPAEALEIAAGSFWFWYVRGYLREGRSWLERLIASAPDAPAESRARALLGLGMMTHWQGDDARALPCLNESLAIWEELGDDWGVAFTLGNVGLIHEDSGAFGEAVPILERALERARRAQDTPNEALLLDHLGVVDWGRGESQTAVKFWQEALELHRKVGDTWGESISLSYLGMVASEQGDFHASEDFLRESMRLRWAMGSREDIAHGLANFAALAAEQAQFERAARLFGAAEAIQDSIGNLVKEPERSFYQRAIEQVERSMPGAAFQAAWSAGRSLRLEEAVPESLRISESARAESVHDPESHSNVAYRLTQRELDVLEFLVAGRTDKQIGESLFISSRTVQVHVANILSKLGVSTRTAAASTAVRENLVNPTHFSA